MDKQLIIDFLSSTFGLQFFLQYIAGKGLDKIPYYKNKKKDGISIYYEFFSEALELLCKKNNWEYDINSVYEVINKENIKICDEINTNEVLSKLLGREYELDISAQWKECITQCLKLPKFDDVFKTYLIDEIEQLKIKNGKLEQALEKRRKDQIEKKTSLLNGALSDIETQEYDTAISKLKQLNCWEKNEKTKFMCLFNLGFCYAKLEGVDNYKKALKWFSKAEKIGDKARDDIVLLYNNMALTYTYLGRNENKIQNYNESIKYYNKVISNCDDNDELYYYSALIHTATNYMDMCDEISIDKVNTYLTCSEAILLYVCYSKCELTEDLLYVLEHNLARLYYQKAEKVDIKYIKISQKLFESLLKQEYVKHNKELLAMLNINTGLAFYGDTEMEKKLDNARSAISYYEIGIEVYKNLNKKLYRHEIMGAQINIAAAYKSIYRFTNDLSDFNECIQITNKVIKKCGYDPQNSLRFRAYLLQLDIYIEAYIKEQNPENYIDITDLKKRIKIMNDQYHYEKYNYTAEVLLYKLDLVLLENTDREKKNKIAEELMNIKEIVSEGNVNMKLVIDEIINEYCNDSE